MKKITAILAIMIFSLLILTSFSANIKAASAQDTGYTIQSVNHQIEVMQSGHVVIRDTIHVTGQLTNGFLIGLPYKYGPYILKSVAYDANHVFPMDLGVQLQDHSGFYGAKVNFPEGNPTDFTIIFILANTLISPVTSNLITGTYTVFNLDIPIYPAFTKDTAKCNVTITLPETPSSISVAKDDGTVDTANFVKENLPAFTYSPAVATFTLDTGILQMIDITKLNRQITASPAGEVTVSDSYRIVNNSTVGISSLGVGLPLDASNIAVKDEFGRILTTAVQTSSGNTQLVNVTFISPLDSGVSTRFTAEYGLPSASEHNGRFTFDFYLFPDFNYYVDEVTVTFVPPEGARFLSPQFSSLDSSSSLNREIFQETFSINREGVSYVDTAVPSENVFQVTYDYNSLWLSFRPTLWVWALAVVGCTILAVWRRPKTSAAPRIVVSKGSAELRPDHVRAFIDAYEEKSRLTSELKSLEVRAQKGKIPRRRYKVQLGSLTGRSDALSKNIAGLKGILRGAGGVYADLVRQLDLAETELDEVETGMSTVEAGHVRGELSLEEYKKALADYERRKEKAETTVNGIMLRLREEIH